MALPVREQVKYWGITTLVFVLILVFLGNVILPFVMAMALAYMLDPIADRLEKLGLSRVLSTVIITVSAALIVIPLLIIVISTLIQQSAELVNIAPELFSNFIRFLEARLPQIFDESSRVHQGLVQIGETISARSGTLISTVFNSALGVVHILVLIVLVPVITFYLLLDWDRMTAEIDKLIPRDHAPIIRKLVGDINKTIAAFIRGQGTVCLILGSFYAIALMIAGLKFGLIAGSIAGALTFIPYVGALVGGALSIGLALFQFWGGVEIIDGNEVIVATDWTRILIVVAIFAAGQFLEGNILTPKLVGTSIGLHPVWLIFALSAFGTLFGFVGMLIAVPVAASIGVLMRFAITQYHSSRLYRGLEGPEDTIEDIAPTDPNRAKAPTQASFEE